MSSAPPPSSEQSSRTQPSSSVGSASPAARGGRRAFTAVAIVALIVIALAALPWFLSTDTSTEAFDAANVSRAEIDVDGRVVVRAGQRPEVVFSRSWRLRPPATEAGVENGVLQVSGRCPNFALFSRCSTNAEVTVPAAAQVVVVTSAGSITVDGVEGGLDLGSSAGGIEVRDVAGPARLHSSAGAIIGTLTGGDVDAESSAGGVTLTLTGPFERLSATSSAGGIDLTVPDEAYRVDADTSAGSVNTDVRTDPDATREIYARSSAGSVTIRRGSSG